jgi:hypothetical protein
MIICGWIYEYVIKYNVCKQGGDQMRKTSIRHKFNLDSLYCGLNCVFSKMVEFLFRMSVTSTELMISIKDERNAS